ncbi:hypothetical protein M427DRAFT_59575 [Gonapodya prolifera JEL478]|uniref:Uncharacterized protein n=1 Tax=Gonapodya prolifera (strain JEL478) TaxID=1344416 RepID=A0A139A7T4_GONPJ|nr:hypothetical protein M427DRAFT_59575 [Gonapodya prolifera JEL478]|eukprot:KXS12433.1 hypothetical protein M427DRAFT_59575 [Gonapodya prolifera JEL478]
MTTFIYSKGDFKSKKPKQANFKWGLWELEGEMIRRLPVRVMLRLRETCEPPLRNAASAVSPWTKISPEFFTSQEDLALTSRSLAHRHSRNSSPCV